MLTSCSEDVLQNETKELNKVVPGTNPKETDDAGNTKPFTITGNYVSPWDFTKLEPVRYYLECNLYSWTGIYVRVTPYIGLAYYDGGNDGTYNSPSGSFNLAGGYPNLYAGGNEYGNYIAANPIVLVGSASTHELAIFSDYITPQATDHCPVMPSVYQYPFNSQPIYFDLVNNNMVQPTVLGLPPITPPPPAATPQEVALLKDYGKVMYYKIEFSRDPANYTDTRYILALKDDGSDALINPLSITDTFGGDLFYHTTFPSREIIVNPTSLSGNPEFTTSGAPITTPLGSFTATTAYTANFVRLYIF